MATTLCQASRPPPDHPGQTHTFEMALLAPEPGVGAPHGACGRWPAAALSRAGSVGGPAERPQASLVVWLPPGLVAVTSSCFLVLPDFTFPAGTALQGTQALSSRVWTQRRGPHLLTLRAGGPGAGTWLPPSQRCAGPACVCAGGGVGAEQLYLPFVFALCFEGVGRAMETWGQGRACHCLLNPGRGPVIRPRVSSPATSLASSPATLSARCRLPSARPQFPPSPPPLHSSPRCPAALKAGELLRARAPGLPVAVSGQFSGCRASAGPCAGCWLRKSPWRPLGRLGASAEGSGTSVPAERCAWGLTVSPPPCEARGRAQGIWQVCGEVPSARHVGSAEGAGWGRRVACALENRDSLFFTCVPEPVLPRPHSQGPAPPRPSSCARIALTPGHRELLFPPAGPRAQEGADCVGTGPRGPDATVSPHDMAPVHEEGVRTSEPSSPRSPWPLPAPRNRGQGSGLS